MDGTRFAKPMHSSRRLPAYCENASSVMKKTSMKKTKSGSAFLSTSGARPIFGTRERWAGA